MPIVAGKEYPYTREGIAAANLAQAGRNEDNALLGGEVAHISGAEADLLRSRGGAGTINPVTGLREYFSGGGNPSRGPTQAMGMLISPTGANLGAMPPSPAFGVDPFANPEVQRRLAASTPLPGSSTPSTLSTPSTPSPDPIIEEVDEEAPFLAASSLNPFSLSSTASSLSPGSVNVAGAPLPPVLVPYDPKLGLGTPSVSSFALLSDPGLVSSGDISAQPALPGISVQPARPGVLVPYDPELGTENNILAHEGGAVMPGLGFRPLRSYDDGTGPQGVESFTLSNPVSQNAPNTLEYQFLRAVEKGVGVKFARTYKNELMSMLQNNEFDRTQTAQIFAQMLADPDFLTGETETLEVPQAQDLESPTGAVGMPSPWNMGFIADPTVSSGELDYVDPGPWTEVGSLMDWRGADAPFPSPPVNAFGRPLPDQDITPVPTGEIVTPELPAGYPGLQAGGHVGRGTMAGELGRRGDLSVRQAGETMFERMKRLRGYANGGYADGYHTPRGTMAGELAPKGSLPVRVAGESMGELHKRHRDQDWYSRMGGGLGSLARRRGVA